jgi:DNA-binding response OmpR family regulator
VEDDVDICTVIEALLTRRGHRTYVVNDARQARALITRFQPTLVLLDLMMPGMNGVELVAEWRRCPEVSIPPIVVVSGDPAVEGKAAEIGACAWLRKPFGLVDLLALIEHPRVSESGNSVDR